MHDLTWINSRMPGPKLDRQAPRGHWLVRAGLQNRIEALLQAILKLRMRQNEEIVVTDAVQHALAGLQRAHQARAEGGARPSIRPRRRRRTRTRRQVVGADTAGT